MDYIIDKSIIDQILAQLAISRRLMFITGAGISAESGLPTYRGVSGLYENKATEEGYPIEQALSGSMFRQNPDITWKYLAQIEQCCRGKKFNRAHKIIAEMEARFESVCVFTQNIDGFHHQAGSTDVIDIHGNIYELNCMACSYQINPNDYSEIEIPPYCPDCKEMVRPNVVLFDEMLPMDKIYTLDGELSKGFDMIFTIGTTSVFPYVAQPVIDASKKGVMTIEINPDETSVSGYVNIKLPTGACNALEQIWGAFNR